MNNSIAQVFNFNSQALRTSGTPDNPMFCLADVCRILGIGNPSDVAGRLPADYLDSIEVVTSNGKVPMCFVNEPGLYEAVFASRKPLAKTFRRWIFEEVIPSIRKTGRYELIAAAPIDPKPELTAARDIAEIHALVDRLSPRYSQFLIDSYLNRQFPALPGDTKRWAGVVEIAEELGLPVDDSNRSKLGKFVKAIVGNLAREEVRLCNGTMRPIAVYPVTEPVIDAVRSQFA